MSARELCSSSCGDILVALSLLRLGSDTKAARLFQEIVRPALSDSPVEDWLLDRLASALRLSPLERSDSIARARRRARQAVEQAKKLGLTILSVLDPAYPHWLAHIPDPPIVLWVRGHLPALSKRAVAVVGSRNATPTGLLVARRLSRDLAEAGFAIVSGLARGIDAAAHRGALDAGKTTVAVLGNGLDVAYPVEHVQLATQIAATGALVTEFPPGTQPHARHFPLRNRIISGLSRAVVVVEASEKSGSLITARAALDQGRDVLAVPGNVASGSYRGCHALIKDGARLVETVEDIFDELGWPARGLSSGDDGKSFVSNGLSALMRPGEFVTVDELALRSGRTAADCLVEVALLEVEGKVARMSGAGFVRLDGPATNIEGLSHGSEPETHLAARESAAGQEEHALSHRKE